MYRTVDHLTTKEADSALLRANVAQWKDESMRAAERLLNAEARRKRAKAAKRNRLA